MGWDGTCGWRKSKAMMLLVLRCFVFQFSISVFLTVFMSIFITVFMPLAVGILLETDVHFTLLRSAPSGSFCLCHVFLRVSCITYTEYESCTVWGAWAEEIFKNHRWRCPEKTCCFPRYNGRQFKHIGNSKKCNSLPVIWEHQKDSWSLSSGGKRCVLAAKCSSSLCDQTTENTE